MFACFLILSGKAVDCINWVKCKSEWYKSSEISKLTGAAYIQNSNFFYTQGKLVINWFFLPDYYKFKPVSLLNFI
jgi:hypothetical protein